VSSPYLSYPFLVNAVGWSEPVGQQSGYNPLCRQQWSFKYDLGTKASCCSVLGTSQHYNNSLRKYVHMPAPLTTAEVLKAPGRS
jgi:hypothetical protein